jgi:Domain of unknown function (DUF4232)
MHWLLLAAGIALAGWFTASVGGTDRARIGPCFPQQLQATVDDDLAAASGTNPALFRLTNRGPRTCLLYGYPDLRLFDRRGRLMPFRIRHGGDIMVSARPPRQVAIGRTRKALVLLDFYRCDLGQRGRAARAELRLRRKDARPMRLAFYPPLCRGTPTTTITVSPFAASRRAVFAH